MGVLRFPLSSKPTEYILVNVQPTTHDLTAKLLATEGLSPYVLNLTSRIATQARSSKAPLSPEEWTDLLKWTLFENRKPGDIEVRADIEEESTLTLVFSKEYSGGLRQRLGSLTLKYKEDEEIELFEWCGQLASQTSELSGKVEEETIKSKKLADEVDELLEAKGKAEKEILGKCLRLINSKKDRVNELEDLLRRGWREVPPVAGRMEVDEEEEPQPIRKGRGRGAASTAKGKGEPVKEESQSQKKTLPRRGKRAAPDPDPEEETDDEPGPAVYHGEDEMDVDRDDDEDAETETQTDGESEHSLEEEAPGIRERASLRQNQAQLRISKASTRPDKKVRAKAKEGNEEEENEGPHVTTRSHDKGHSQSQSYKEKKAALAPADEGSETESDDEL